MAELNLTAERLRELLHYDPETGVFNWRSTGVGRRSGRSAGCTCATHHYVFIRLERQLYAAHRLAWMYVYGEWPKLEIDHINGVRDDNRISNLRDVTRRVNTHNRRHSTAKSGLMGAYFHAFSNSWQSKIRLDGKVLSLGYHKTAELAHQAYVAAKRRLHEGCTI